MNPYVDKVVEIFVAAVRGLLWAFAVIGIPLLITQLTQVTANKNIPGPFDVTIFIMVTALAIYSQSIIGRFNEMIGKFWRRAGDEVRRSATLQSLLEIIICAVGIIFIMIWFISQLGKEYKIFDDIYKLDSYQWPWFIAIIMMPLFGFIRSLDHSFFIPTTSTPIP